MEPSSPASGSESSPVSSPPSSPTPSDSVPSVSEGSWDARKKKKRKKRKGGGGGSGEDEPIGGGDGPGRKPGGALKKGKKKKEGKLTGTTKEALLEDGAARKKARKQQRRAQQLVVATDRNGEQLTAAQVAVNEQMRRALEEDQYSALGSVVDTESDDDDNQYQIRGRMVRLDRPTLLLAMRKRLWMERMNGNGSSSAVVSGPDDDGEPGDILTARVNRGGRKKKRKKGRRSKEEEAAFAAAAAAAVAGSDNDADRAEEISGSEVMSLDEPNQLDIERDEGSIFGQTTGSSNATWVECDKCKKWRRLRGVVDEKKLPTKWYCSMNKNDPERARCSAPEEEYEASNTPESAADARTRKHLRVWVRRLQCNESYEARQPTMTRGKKRSATASSKEPYEWIRCCNPSCGKWRAILRFMDAKTHVMDRTAHGEWYCVMNTWDEKTASCAAPQENLPAIGCPPWVMQDDNGGDR